MVQIYLPCHWVHLYPTVDHALRIMDNGVEVEANGSNSQRNPWKTDVEVEGVI